MSWSAIMKVAPTLDPGIVRIGFIFVMVGYGSKAGLAPMHLWLPDAHSQAPTPVSTLLSGVLIKCALLAIIRFQTIAAAACGPAFPAEVLLVFGLISVVVATPFILVQQTSSASLATTASNTSGSWRSVSASAAPSAPTVRCCTW